MSSTTHTNHLIRETSPYLLQHAHNPVDWWPWCEEALRLAREQDKLILLSIGYSACHWCHVMAHESFEDPATARVMNELYINIKVDREERPDLDKIYQTAHQLLNQRGGGWPLTMILTPDDHIPFFAGTYFPVSPRHGLPAFKDILTRVHDFYREHGDQIETQNASMLHALGSLAQSGQTNASLNAAPLDQARKQLAQQFDAQYAGFGKAPKFPHPTNLERLLHHWAGTRAHGREDKEALHMLHMTLHAMASGGIYDQLGGGFCRYSVDDYWMIPHFEKMLYDNGPLLALYSETYAATGDAVFKRISEETAQWVMREMQSPEGGYYSTLDADSEGEEGRFYVWTPKQVKALLSEQEYAVTARIYGLDRSANFEGHWHLHIFEDLADVAKEIKLSAEDATRLLISAREKLFTAREQRVRPGRDDKILTSWNGLMIKGMACAARYLDNDEYLHSAQRAVDFIRETLFVDGRLLATYKDGKAHLMAYLDDYAFMLDGLMHLLQAKWRTSDLEFAIALAEAMLTHFEDQQHGGFYFTAHDHETLIQRPKNFMDEAIPAGNAIATLALARLGHLLGEQRYLDSAERALRCAWDHIEQAAYAHAAFLQALEEYLYPPQLIVIRGNDEDGQWRQAISTHYAPRRLCFIIPATESGLPGLLGERKPAEHGDRAYVCSGMQCLAPVADVKALIAQLAQNR
ncbi:MAG: DUF255 domain-containing protein [Gammaproteobacteria bacterium]|nr:DUF255 domain-containing protein [Gammaproteobacteria bacterium]